MLVPRQRSLSHGPAQGGLSLCYETPGVNVIKLFSSSNDVVGCC